MEEAFKLKTVYFQEKQIKAGKSYNHISLEAGDSQIFHIPAHMIVDMQYESTDQQHLLRIIFQLDTSKLTIQYFTWNESEQFYIEAPLTTSVLYSASFQSVLQNISFTGERHLSYLVTNTLQQLKN